MPLLSPNCSGDPAHGGRCLLLIRQVQLLPNERPLPIKIARRGRVQRVYSKEVTKTEGERRPDRTGIVPDALH